MARLRQVGLAVLLAAGLAGLSGCKAFAALGALSAPKTEKIAPEFNKLKGQRVLVMVWVPIEVKWDYPYIRLELAKHVGSCLRAHIKDIELVDEQQVEDYLGKTRGMESNPRAVGKQFDADMVIYLAVYQFSVRDPGMAHYYRGRLSSSVEVYDLTTGDAEAQRIPLKEAKAVYPEDREVGFANVRPEQIRQATYEAYASIVGRKFYEWERPLD